MERTARRILQNVSGYTLSEVMLVVAIVSIIAVVTAPIYLSFQKNNAVDLSLDNLVQDLYQAQIYSRSEAHACGWGVSIISQTKITLFCGNTYATRSSGYDVTYVIPSNIAVTGTTEFDFSKLYGLPSAAGSVTLSGGGKTKTVTVNSKGMVDY